MGFQSVGIEAPSEPQGLRHRTRNRGVGEVIWQVIEDAFAIAAVAALPFALVWENCVIERERRALASDPLLDRDSPSPPPVVD